MNRVLIVTALLSGLVGCRPEKPVLGQMRVGPDTEASYEVLAVKYCTLPPTKRSAFLKGGGSEPVDAGRMSWILRSDERVIVVDPGFSDPALAAEINCTLEVPTSAALAEVGIGLEDVTDVFLTQNRHSRIDAVDEYPRAKVWMQAASLNYALSYLNRNKARDRGIRNESIDKLVALDEQGRVEWLDTNVKFAPGLQAHTGDLVQKWFNYFAVRTGDGVVVLASDAVPLQANIDKRQRPPGVAEELWLETLDTMQILTAEGGMIVPGVDVQVYEAGEKLSPHVRKLASP